MRRHLRAPSVVSAALISLTLVLGSGGVASADPVSTEPAPAEPVPVKPVPIDPIPDSQPPGADDGLPVGPARPQGAATAPSQQVGAAAVTPDVTHRYFGAGPWAAIKTAADNQSVCSGLTHPELQAMVLTTIFRESGGATSAGSEPAPMTLSRYDEWTGVRAGNTNINANYGLYAFRNPNTSYKRVFWHPGIGIWQYDSAGIGAPYTAAERISTGFLAPKVAADMAGAYCTSTQTTEQGKRYDAWYPWYLSCDTDPEWTGSQVNPNATYCEQIYQGLMQKNFSNVTRTAGISSYGGEVQHTCVLNGVDSYPCWLVDPTKAQGATWWATRTPLDGGAPNRTTSPVTPISTPFYVIKRNGLEQRYWLAEDSGYARDVTGTRVLGKNARPKDNQSGSGVTWSYGTGLCDVNLVRGACGPRVAPPGVHSTKESVTGTYQVIPLDVDGNGLDDLLYYGPGAAKDSLWLNLGSGNFRSVTTNIPGVYQVIPLDADGNGRDDLFLYNSTTGSSSLWLSRGDGTFAATSVQAPKGLRIVALDHNRNHRQELLMYGPGGAADAYWEWTGSGFRSTKLSIGGNYRPLVGDFDNNGTDDLLFYAAGNAQDYLWLYAGSGALVSRPVTVNGSYQPLVADLDGDGKDDVFWYGPGAAPDSVWFGGPGGAFVSKSAPMNGSYQPVLVDLPKDGRTDVAWYRPGLGQDYWSRWDSARRMTLTKAYFAGSQQAIGGRFSATGDGIFWYGPGAVTDWLWWQ
ncbi:FG-GAP repeat domain-containing protein [Nakamurella lactea]|uniref:FG-GAP repeat domain-containing protein n=1 Tax=Nakamurella lactea TaxID=459515 RepID=UPI000407E5B4|nr:VCBS repeat-containing protein [Nakamurella lactea]